MIFLDNASTTQISKEALDVYNFYSIDKYFNPSALYMKGANIHQEILKAKSIILDCLGASKFDNIIFTSGATESNNMTLRAFIKKGKKALIGVSEHPSVYNVAKAMLDDGYDIDYVNITEAGTIDIDDFKAKMTPDVNFVSIMHVNNETGAINPIKDLIGIAKHVNKNVIFHSDGVQACGKIFVDLDDLGVDLYTLSSHKIFGPKGIGALYVRKGVNIRPFMFGGGQENMLRSGTENTPAIFAFTKAVQLACENFAEHYSKAKQLSEYLKDKLRSLQFDIKINSNEDCSPYIVSFSVANLRAETILRMLEEDEILIGNGSACSSHKKGNRILSNMHVEDKYIEGSLRVSFNYDTTKEDLDFFVAKLKDVISEYKNKTNR